MTNTLLTLHDPAAARRYYADGVWHDDTLRQPEDMERLTQLPVLGVIVRPKAQRRLAFRRRSTALVAR